MVLNRGQIPGFVLLVYMFALGAGAFAFFSIYLRQNGFSFVQITALYAIIPLFSVIVLLFANKISVKKFLLAAFVLDGVILIVFGLGSPIAAYFTYMVFISFFGLLLWTPLNYICFRDAKKNKNATGSAIYYAVIPATSMIAPPIAGYVIHTFGFSIHFTLLGLATIAFSLFIWKKVPEKVYTSSYREMLDCYSSLRIITMIDGALHFLTFFIIPLYALLFIKSELTLGGLLGYLGLIGMLISLFLAHRSDKKKKRLKFLVPTFILYAMAIAMIPLAQNLFWLFVVIGLYSLMDNLSNPMRLTVLLDTKKADIHFWRAREFFLNIGRVIVLSFTVLLFFFELYWVVFAMYACLVLLFPLLVKQKLKHIS